MVGVKTHYCRQCCSLNGEVSELGKEAWWCVNPRTCAHARDTALSSSTDESREERKW